MKFQKFSEWPTALSRAYNKEYTPLLFSLRCCPRVHWRCCCQLISYQVLLQGGGFSPPQNTFMLIFIRDCRYKAEPLLIMPLCMSVVNTRKEKIKLEAVILVAGQLTILPTRKWRSGGGGGGCHWGEENFSWCDLTNNFSPWSSSIVSTISWAINVSTLKTTG